MIKKNFLTAPLLLLTVLVFTWMGCQKQYNPDIPIIATITDSSINISIQEKVTASLQGRIVDENGKPVSSASVISATNNTTTDINGIFNFTNIQLSKNAGTVSVEKTGYFKGTRTFITSTSAINYVEIRLIPKIAKATFLASAGCNVIIENSNAVKFNANSIVTAATNVTYTGTVKVYAAYLDPTSSILAAIMPGNLTGMDSSNKLQLLQTFGMLAVELEGASGEKLQIATGQKATITTAIPSSLTAFAPATIPLWYFNDSLGVWKQEGTATKQGNIYIGNVSHFSFWNCDVSVNSITIKMNLKNQSAQAMSYSRVELTNLANNTATYGITDSLGTVAGVIPSNVALQLKVYDKCGGIIYTQNIGPYKSTADLGTITITAAASASITINGSLINCAGMPVTKGYAEIKLDGSMYRAAVDTFGKYAIVINRCNNIVSSAIITGVDLQNNMLGNDTIKLTVQTGAYNAASVKVCGPAINKFINCTISGKMYNLSLPSDSLLSQFSTPYNKVYGTNNGNSNTNLHTIFYVTVDSSLGARTFYQFNLNNLANNFIVVAQKSTGTITEYGSIGNYLAGSFSGTVFDVQDSSQSNPFPMTCNFRIKRR